MEFHFFKIQSRMGIWFAIAAVMLTVSCGWNLPVRAQGLFPVSTEVIGVGEGSYPEAVVMVEWGITNFPSFLGTTLNFDPVTNFTGMDLAGFSNLPFQINQWNVYWGTNVSMFIVDLSNANVAVVPPWISPGSIRHWFFDNIYPPQPLSLNGAPSVPSSTCVGQTAQMDFFMPPGYGTPGSVKFNVGRRLTSPWNDTSIPLPTGQGQVFLTEAHHFSFGDVEEFPELYAPPYTVYWTPTNVGRFSVWVEGTNTIGQSFSSTNAEILVFEANDDIAHAIEIAPTTGSAAFPFHSLWCSVETNEVPSRLGRWTHSVWWKWTPAFSAKMRFKASRAYEALAIEVLEEMPSGKVRAVVGNAGKNLDPGQSALVTFNVRANHTYYLRTGKLKPSGGLVQNSPLREAGTPDSMFKMEPANAPLPGLIDFSLMLSAKTRPGQQPKLVTLGRVLGPDGKPLHEAGYCAQLYCGRQRSHLTPVGELSLVFGGMVGYGGSSLELYNGLLSMQIIQLPNVRPGEKFYAQIKVWKRSDGETFEEARDNGGPTGTSEIIIATAGSEIDGARKLIGVRNIRVMPPN